MKIILLLLTFISITFSKQYTFLVDDYNKELELEAEIIYNIASASLKKPILLYIPEPSPEEKQAFSQYFTLTASCSDSNFVYVKKSVKASQLCQKQERVFFTNNYQKLLADSTYYGAFFWHKSRPNIVFIKDRLETNKIELPRTYEKYVEDF